MKSAKEMSLCWNPGTNRVALVPWPDYGRLSDSYDCVGLACYKHIREASYEHRKMLVFVEAMQLIVQDGCEPRAVHQALSELEEYQDGWMDYSPF